jgi:hypothetical protein
VHVGKKGRIRYGRKKIQVVDTFMGPVNAITAVVTVSRAE